MDACTCYISDRDCGYYKKCKTLRGKFTYHSLRTSGEKLFDRVLTKSWNKHVHNIRCVKPFGNKVLFKFKAMIKLHLRGILETLGIKLFVYR